MSEHDTEQQTQLRHSLKSYPQTVTDRVLQHWQRLAEHEDNIGEQLTAEQLAELAKVWGLSEFASRLCARYPGFLRRVLAQGSSVPAYEELQLELQQQLQPVNEEDQLKQVLRDFRNFHLLRIAWADISDRISVAQTLEQLSYLADACINGAVAKLDYWLQGRWGVPMDEQSAKPLSLLVLAMGKLGARELNFSSDIDLIFLYAEEGMTRGGGKQCTNHEYFTRLGQQLIRVLDETTAHGFVYRVDMRLRPFGSSGPLAISVDALENYFLTHAREWERYAMIKARVISGSEDERAELNTRLKPFVYRRYLDFAVYDALREMKQKIVVEVHRKELSDNIKLGAGGIREVEFIGQAFQLIRGGREPGLQQREICRVLQVLADQDYLPDYVVAQLIESYWFLRRAENRLQQVNDRQTHDLPTKADAQQVLALTLGFDSWPQFLSAMVSHRHRVHSHFQQVFAAPQLEQNEQDAYTQQLQQLWQDQLEPETANAILGQLGYADPSAVSEKMQVLRASSSYRSLSVRGKQRLDGLMPLLLSATGRSDKPDAVLELLLSLIQTIARRTSYLALLSENPMALSQLVRLCAASPWIAKQISQFPLLLDELLDPRTLYQPPGREQLVADLDRMLSHVEPLDLEAQMDSLRHFKQTSVLRVAAADIMDAVPLMVVSDHLTDIAEVILEQVLRIAWQHLVSRHGLPGGISDYEHCGFAVIAYGKLGGIEMGYSSDLDLVFVYQADANAMSQGDKAVANSVFYSRLGQRVIHILTAFTTAGTLYEVDMRLRPSGASGLLVTQLPSFVEYQEQKAWTWEHQALVRARPVAGDIQLREEFNLSRQQVLAREHDLVQLREDVRSMRERMRAQLDSSDDEFFDIKQGAGGITDIEFVVQYMALAWGWQHPGLLRYTDNVRILESAGSLGILGPEETRRLADIYRGYRAKVHRLALQQQKPRVEKSLFDEQCRQVCALWQQLLQSVSD